MAGEIVSIGEGVNNWKVGDRVCANFSTDHLYGDPTPESLKTSLGGPIHGVLTEFRTFPAYSLVSIPEHLSYEEASTLPCAALTAYNALLGPVPIKAGDHVLILGTGGVSIFGLQFAAASGATVIATSSSDAKLKIAGQLGARHLINYKTNPDWEKEVLRITNGQGVDHVIEIGGLGTLPRSIKSTRTGGHIHLIGIVSKDVTEEESSVVFSTIRKSLSLRGILIGSVAQFKDMNKLLAAQQNNTRPHIDRVFPFEKAKEAYSYLASQVHVAQLAALALLLAPSLASAAIFPKDSLVKMLDPKGFRKAMKANHCQRMAPEYSKAALGLHPLLPVYAVDCDAAENKRLCADQLYPRGSQLGSMTYESGERTASALFYWASRRIPNAVEKLYKVEDIAPWVEKKLTKHRALLLTKDKKVPLLWKVLGNKYKDQLELGTHRDRKGKSSVEMGLEAGGPKEAKVLIYPAGSTNFVKYEGQYTPAQPHSGYPRVLTNDQTGLNKFDSLSKFFDSVLDGSADLSAINKQAAAEEFAPDEKELEIERQQEAQRIALAHGGLVDIIDFEKAVKEGAGANYHDTHGYPGMMGSVPTKKAKESEEAKEATTEETPKTPTPEVVADSGTEQVVLEQPKEVKKPAPGGNQCAPAEDGPGAEAPVDCNPPVTPERLADEL
ncbi:hypothetical protein DXG01_003923 [Tephrocybe rancida]|nr:hypothetical protein DXG01_003923 [Tephrocybe rancida]